MSATPSADAPPATSGNGKAPTTLSGAGRRSSLKRKNGAFALEALEADPSHAAKVVAELTASSDNLAALVDKLMALNEATRAAFTAPGFALNPATLAGPVAVQRLLQAALMPATLVLPDKVARLPEGSAVAVSVCTLLQLLLRCMDGVRAFHACSGRRALAGMRATYSDYAIVVTEAYAADVVRSETEWRAMLKPSSPTGGWSAALARVSAGPALPLGMVRAWLRLTTPASRRAKVAPAGAAGSSAEGKSTTSASTTLATQGSVRRDSARLLHVPIPITPQQSDGALVIHRQGSQAAALGGGAAAQGALSPTGGASYMYGPGVTSLEPGTAAGGPDQAADPANPTIPATGMEAGSSSVFVPPSMTSQVSLPVLASDPRVPRLKLKPTDSFRVTKARASVTGAATPGHGAGTGAAGAGAKSPGTTDLSRDASDAALVAGGSGYVHPGTAHASGDASGAVVSPQTGGAAAAVAGTGAGANNPTIGFSHMGSESTTTVSRVTRVDGPAGTDYTKLGVAAGPATGAADGSTGISFVGLTPVEEGEERTGGRSAAQRAGAGERGAGSGSGSTQYQRQRQEVTAAVTTVGSHALATDSTGSTAGSTTSTDGHNTAVAATSATMAMAVGTTSSIASCSAATEVGPGADGMTVPGTVVTA